MIASIARGLTIGLMSLGLTMGSVAFAQTSDDRPVQRQVRAANVSVSMSPDEIHPGQRTRVTIVMENTGDVTIAGATIIDRLPKDLKYVDHSANGDLLKSLTPSRNSHGYLVWHLKDVKPGRQASVWFDVRPDNNVLGTRCTVALLDPMGLGHPSSSACVSVVKVIPTPKPTPTPVVVHCGPGTHKVGNKCVVNPTPKPVHCGVGTHRVGNACLPNHICLVCPPRPVIVPGGVQNQNQVQNNNQVTNVDVHNDNNNNNDIDITLNK